VVQLLWMLGGTMRSNAAGRVGHGVANTYRHNRVRDCLFRMAKELQVMVGREPQFPVQAPGLEARWPDLVFFDWDNGRDIYVDVVGSSPLAQSYRECYVPGGAVVRAGAHKMAFYWQVMAHQPSRVAFELFAFDCFGGLHSVAVGHLNRFQGLVSQASVSIETFSGIIMPKWHS
jgi:hypothetical protein